MSYASLMVHPLAIIGPTITGDPEDIDDLDEYGQPTAGTSSVTYVRGMVQPLRADEVARLSQAGAEIADFRIFLPWMRLSGAAYIRDEPAAGRRFDIVGVYPFEFGTVPHLEVLTKIVGSTEGPLADGS